MREQDKPEFPALFMSRDAIGAALAGLYAMEYQGLVPRQSQAAVNEAKSVLNVGARMARRYPRYTS